jgi:hypothetical protein
MPRLVRGLPVFPVAGARDGSKHLLKPPNGAKPLVFLWVAKESAWERFGGTRMAFTGAYLGAHGWGYVGRAK